MPYRDLRRVLVRFRAPLQSVLDHYKHHAIRAAGRSAWVSMNPICGGESRCESLRGRHKVADLSMTDKAVPDQQATTWVLTEQVIGQRVTRALNIVDAFTQWCPRGTVPGDEDVMPRAIGSRSPGYYPAGDTALLRWMAFKDALAKPAKPSKGGYRYRRTSAPRLGIARDVEESDARIVDPELGIQRR